MRVKQTLILDASRPLDDASIREAIAQTAGLQPNAITGFHLLKKSLDARSRQIRYQLQVEAFVNEPFHPATSQPAVFREVTHAARQAVIVGAGPAGLFAALRCLQQGIRPVVIERGKDVRTRRRDLAQLNRSGIVNPESNYCFGEGGAGTYSDGKLYTRSNKRGSIDEVLNLFVQFGAPENILYEAHPHIGTNKLPKIIERMRQQILDCGGQVLFEHKVTDFIVQSEKCTGVVCENGHRVSGDWVMLATGHSARDIYRLLHRLRIPIQVKPFALGVRVEHPQPVIDEMQYRVRPRPMHLPPASYSLVHQAEDRGVFSFCMCPGGIIAPASTSQHELVVNGWSPSKRNNPFANSGMVAEVRPEDFNGLRTEYCQQFDRDIEPGDPLWLLAFQELIERRAALAGGGNLVAPANRMVDFCRGKISTSLPGCSYLPGIVASDLEPILSKRIAGSLKESLQAFGKKRKGYYTNEAVLVATESRTSSPVRIPRHPETHEHITVQGLFPAAEGAGYAGGIVSAAIDGINTVEKALALYGK